MKKRKITVKIDSTLKYLSLWNGIFNLTTKEIQILSSFIDVNSIRGEDNICSVTNKKDVAVLVGIKDYNTLNNYIKKFKDKGALLLNSAMYKLNPFLDPNTDVMEITINKV